MRHPEGGKGVAKTLLILQNRSRVIFKGQRRKKPNKGGSRKERKVGEMVRKAGGK